MRSLNILHGSLSNKLWFSIQFKYLFVENILLKETYRCLSCGNRNKDHSIVRRKPRGFLYPQYFVNLVKHFEFFPIFIKQKFTNPLAKWKLKENIFHKIPTFIISILPFHLHFKITSLRFNTQLSSFLYIFWSGRLGTLGVTQKIQVMGSL